MKWPEVAGGALLWTICWRSTGAAICFRSFGDTPEPLDPRPKPWDEQQVNLLAVVGANAGRSAHNTSGSGHFRSASFWPFLRRRPELGSN